MAFEAETLIQTAEYEARNPEALEALITEHGVQMRRYPEELVAQMAKYSFEVVKELGETDPMAQKIYASYSSFNDKAIGWARYGMQGFLNAREKYYPKS